MGVPISIDELINGEMVESTRIEYKTDFNPNPILHSICAFANDIDNIGGGYIVIGVEEENGSPKLPIKGIAKNRIDSIMKKLLNLCHFIEPFYEPVAEPMMYEGKHVIVLWCAGGFGRPYKASKDSTANQSVKFYYIRKMASSKIASPEEERELFYISSTIPFDDRPNLAATVSDLDGTLLREHLKEIESSLYALSTDMSTEEIARDMQLLDGPPENVHPRNIALLMFSNRTQDFFRYARIEVVDIPDSSGRNMTEKVFTGPIQYQLRDALQYISNYVLKQMIIKKNGRVATQRIWNYPYQAVKELLANAVYHRSYQIQEPITVRITPKGMEITSFPGFDRSITQEDIDRGEIRGRVYRNRRIGDFLKELGLIEGRNTGFPNARRALRENGSPDITFDMDLDRQYLSVTIPVHPDFISNRARKDDAYEEKLIAALRDEPLSLTELSKKMGYKGISKKLRDTVNELSETGRIQAVYEGRSVRYKS